MSNLVYALEQIEILTKQTQSNIEYIQTLQKDIIDLQKRVKKLEGK